MQSSSRILAKYRIVCQPPLPQRLFAQRFKEGTTCPPCDQHKPAPKLPLTARQYRQKECCPCDYYFEMKELRNEPPPCKYSGPCKLKPCPPETQRTINQCEKRKAKDCPRGDWDSPEPRKN